ncbi:DinB family protein [Dyadobacter sp. CY261]|uniref:DinB family protein n=1 Tax=Dyadobacter sp. CY261 TaxID=2907203 RepID=UPI001F328925|nr:DinB family protein [Dyadobacter sp. CY261]MCF0073017.1 DinB family protein [Dyadobacter sp. CY261]
MKEQLLITLENSRKYTLAVASALPEATFQFKPAEEVWSFAELLSHIAYGIYWWEENYIRGTESDWSPPASAQTKVDAQAALEAAYDMLAKSVNALKPDTDQLNGFHATLDHITHHRGQATTYLRCCGIEPPTYVY